jgi:hypothetical protein
MTARKQWNAVLAERFAHAWGGHDERQKRVNAVFDEGRLPASQACLESQQFRLWKPVDPVALARGQCVGRHTSDPF